MLHESDVPERERAPEAEHCCICGCLLLEDMMVAGQPWCEVCNARWPQSLLKATIDDPWDYAMRLRTGEVYRFIGAKIYGEYARLHGDLQGGSRDINNSIKLVLSWPSWKNEISMFPRGLDVRISDIVWCVDAPIGS